MSQSTKDLLLKARKMIPPLLEKFHKGQMGRVAVIGGSEDYTGAPYFSAMASARLGADMSHVICEPQASVVIKSYSPNLMVHPYMRQSHHATAAETGSSVSAKVIELLARIHVLVIGPGLGRDPLMLDTCARVINAARRLQMPFVLDADGLYLAQTRPELVHGYRQCILTPNVTEFARLARSQNIDASQPDDHPDLCPQLARALGGVTIIQKGARDLISDGDRTYISDREGGRKRSGGQGDTLTGCLATFLAWRKAYLDRIWECVVFLGGWQFLSSALVHATADMYDRLIGLNRHDNDLSPEELFTLAAFAGSSLTRECSRLAFQKHGRALQAGDLTEEVSRAFVNLFEGEDGKV
ncbi:MAG: hypothetical protein M1826_003537 [Phylliscum demangeonii]|nr:MAG: hypothetical protein M1826_003537 [Phylliscum demangeonii]